MYFLQKLPSFHSPCIPSALAGQTKQKRHQQEPVAQGGLLRGVIFFLVSLGGL
nr:MAG TPA: hypothetical protein [Caudoviricetes sp.]